MKILRNSLNDHIRKSVILRSIFTSVFLIFLLSFYSFAFEINVSQGNVIDNGVFTLNTNAVYRTTLFSITGLNGDTVILNPDVDYFNSKFNLEGYYTSSNIVTYTVDNPPYTFPTTVRNITFGLQFVFGSDYKSNFPIGDTIDLSKLGITVNGIPIFDTPSSPISTNLKNTYVPVGCALEFDMEGLTGNVTFNGSTPANNLGIRGIFNLDLWYSQPVTSGAWYGSFETTIDQISLADYPIITGINSTSTNGGLSAINFTPTKFSAIGNIQEYEFSGTISNYNRYIYIAYPYQVYSANGLATSGSGSDRNSGSLTVRIPDNIPARLVYLNTGATYATITASEYTVDENGNYIDSNGNIVTEEQIKNSQNYQEDLGSTIQSATQGFLDKLINSIIGVFEKPIQALQNLYNNGASYISYLQNLWSWIPSEVTSFLISAFIVVFSIGIIKSLL